MCSLLLWALSGLALARAQTTTTTTASSLTTTTVDPVAQAATDSALATMTTALATEQTALNAYLDALAAVQTCQSQLADATSIQTVMSANLAQITALNTNGATALKTPAALTLAAGQVAAGSATAQTVAYCSTQATTAVTNLQSTATPPAGTCPTAQTTATGLYTPWQTAVSEAQAAQTAYATAAAAAPPSSASSTTSNAATLNAAAAEAWTMERTAATNLANAYVAANACPATVTAAQGNLTCSNLYNTAITGMQTAINANTDTTQKSADQAILTTTIVTAANSQITDANTAITTAQAQCSVLNAAILTNQTAWQTALANATAAQTAADNPGATTTTTMATTTVAATTAASGTATTTAAAANPTVNVDGVPLSPSTPCCMKAASGMCYVSLLIRNMCNTECGCSSTTGTCTGKPPPKCTTDNSGNVGMNQAPTSNGCGNRYSDETACTNWAKNGDCKISVTKGFWMQNQCKKACNLCGKADIDQWYCWGWAVLGECTGSGSTWMTKNCVLSCGNLALNPSKMSMAQRRKMIARMARARTIKRIKAARASAVAKVKRRRAKAARAALAKKGKGAKGRRALRAAAARRRRLRQQRARAAARRSRALAKAKGRD